MLSEMASVLAKLPPHKTGKHGQLQEWYYDFDEFDVTHRHLSHLFAFYPDDDIDFYIKHPDAVPYPGKRRWLVYRRQLFVSSCNMSYNPAQKS